MSLAADTVDRGTRAARCGVQLPARLKRPHSTPAKIIDEYLWVKITREL